MVSHYEMLNNTHHMIEQKNNNKLNILLFCGIIMLIIHIFIICTCIYIYITERSNIIVLYTFIKSINTGDIETTIKNITLDVNTILETFGSVDNIRTFILKINIIVDTVCDFISCSNITMSL